MYQTDQYRTIPATPKTWKQNIYARIAVAFAFSAGVCILTFLGCYLVKSFFYGNFSTFPPKMTYIDFKSGWETVDRVQWIITGGIMAVFVLYAVYELVKYQLKKTA